MASPIWPIEEIALDSTGDMVAGSLGDMVDHLYDHLTTTEKVYPTLAAGVDVVTANADWTLGVFSQVVPASTIGTDFHVIDVCIENCNQNAVFEVVLYAGAGDTEVGRIRFAAVGGFWGNARYSIDTDQIDADSRIRAKAASSDGAANQATITISVGYIAH